jgi:DNA topoisomerase VI subunit A
MVPQVARVANEYGVPVISSGGTDSITEKYALGIETRYFDRKKNPFGVHVLHIGDLDPHGIHIFIALAEDASAFNREAKNDYTTVDFTRLAVTPAQIIDLSLTTNPVKIATAMPAYPYDFTCQAEAIPPDKLAEIVRSAITDQREELTGWKFNEAAYARVLKAEKRLQKSLLKRLKARGATS